MAWKVFQERGIPARILMVARSDHSDGHAAAVFETPDGSCLVYDERGSRDLKGINLNSAPLEIARRAFGSKVTGAYFYGVRRPSGADKDRRMSPREVRGRSLFTL
jgi:hypothetical protein